MILLESADSTRSRLPVPMGKIEVPVRVVRRSCVGGAANAIAAARSAGRCRRFFFRSTAFQDELVPLIEYPIQGRP